MKRKRKAVQDKGSYIVDETLIGECNDKTVAIVMDNVFDLGKRKPRVKVIRTEKISLHAGESTVIVFHVRRKKTEVAATPELNTGNLTNALAAYSQKMKERSLG